ncbi:hypothetical protein L596_021235 [Steinernema carpocapsae]|uniref:Uncharacterized protein n=1 Tax=Steinernema carpocapsae TaxID=34508 RepID=A0A4U5MW02_STECR|nr:hypothetical protein L596_021235 [Steinernema carpocapsae]
MLSQHSKNFTDWTQDPIENNAENLNPNFPDDDQFSQIDLRNLQAADNEDETDSPDEEDYVDSDVDASSDEREETLDAELVTRETPVFALNVCSVDILLLSKAFRGFFEASWASSVKIRCEFAIFGFEFYRRCAFGHCGPTAINLTAVQSGQKAAFVRLLELHAHALRGYPLLHWIWLVLGPNWCSIVSSFYVAQSNWPEVFVSRTRAEPILVSKLLFWPMRSDMLENCPNPFAKQHRPPFTDQPVESFRALPSRTIGGFR